jgi:hypothetical protein
MEAKGEWKTIRGMKKATKEAKDQWKKPKINEGSQRSMKEAKDQWRKPKINEGSQRSMK